MKTPRNILAVILTLVSLGLLWPGLTEPVLTITASMKLFGPPKEIFRQSQSIVQSVRTLWNGGNMFVACLILLFSITVPFIKAVILLIIFTTKNAATQSGLFRFVRSVSKWAMADVFVVGIFIAFLAANAISNLHATAERGFYFFAAYCLMSNVAFALLEVPGSARATA
ncbi:MAG: paraquat-inducible protein A [Gemmatimonadaceae bacterium]